MDGSKDQVAEGPEELQERVKQLVYLFSHDMRNPLVNMKALLGELKELVDEAHRGNRETLDTELSEVVSLLEASIERMNSMIRGANDLYHCMFDAIEYEEVDLHELAGRMASRFESHNGIEFSIGELAVVHADPLAMARIVEELFANASASMGGKGGTISVSSEKRGDSDVLIVRHSSRRMSGEDIARVFDLFHSGSEAARGEGRAGLAIVKALVEAHGGKVWYESGRGGGTVFYVSLPRQAV